MNQKLVTVSLCLAFWSTIVWLVQRTFDRSDEPWGLLSLATVIVILVFGPAFNLSSASGVETKMSSQVDASRLTMLKDFTGLSCLLFHFLLAGRAPLMVHALLMILAIYFLVVSKLTVPSKSGMFGLLLLVLPVTPSIDFYAGYPVRFVIAMGTRLLLSCLGMPAHQEGTVLSINQKMFAIDVPCSGIHMLWVEAYGVMLLATIFRLNLKQTVVLGLAGSFLIMVGNVFRASTLIIFDLLSVQTSTLNVGQFEPLVHPLVGLFSFCLVTGAIAFLAQRLSSLVSVQAFSSSRETENEISGDLKNPSLFPDSLTKIPLLRASLQPKRLQWIVVSLCAASAVLPFLAHPTDGAGVIAPPPIWPQTINGVSLTVVDSLREEQAFASDFPGHMKRFTDGTNSYFVRCVNKDTRQLHPSSDCFKGLGYAVESKPIVIGADGHRWSSFLASKDQNKYLVMERIYNDHGDSWTDVSEWYWAACLGKSKGPWFAVTIAKPG
jgi:exosortase/archaeosortase family protein